MTEMVPPAPPPTAHAPRGRRVLLLGIIVAAGLLVVYATSLRELLGPDGVERVRRWIADQGTWGPLVFVGGSALGVTAGAPRLFFAAVAGAAFGWVAGSALALAGALLGCLITFSYARRLGRPWVRARIGDRFARLDDAFLHHGVLMNLLLRAAPVGNCHLANLVLALSPIPPRAFVLGTALGMAPETIIYALFGSAAAGGVVLRVTSAAVLLIVLGVTFAVIYRRSSLAARIASEFTERRS